MNIQSLSIVVPNRVCMNHCASCPSRMHDNNYPMRMDASEPDFDLALKDYIRRLEFARDNGCNTLMLTGTSEPQQNRNFLLWFGMIMQLMKSPFHCIEMQTTGASIDEDYIAFMRRHVGLTLMALSVFSLDDDENMDIINPPKGIGIDVESLCYSIKAAGLSLRMCLNMTDCFDMYETCPQLLFERMRDDYQADQVTIRVLYAGEDDCPENVWVREHSAKKETIAAIRSYIKENGQLLGRLPYGACKYSVMGMSIVLDDDSMGKDQDTDAYKYLILRPDCKLYSSWDDKASLIF